MFRTTIISAALITSALVGAQVVQADDAKPYTVVDGVKVDTKTMEGFRVWREANCAACHGPNQEGLVGPSLIKSLQVLSKDEFVTTITAGRLERGMPAWNANKRVMDNIDSLYAYLKGRSDGAITRTKPEMIAQ